MHVEVDHTVTARLVPAVWYGMPRSVCMGHSILCLGTCMMDATTLDTWVAVSVARLVVDVVCVCVCVCVYVLGGNEEA